MTNMKDLDAELDLPMDEDENVGDGVPQKKKIKRKKTKEERMAERRVIFWTLIVILGVTIFFRFWPILQQRGLTLPSFNSSSPKDKEPGVGWKNYVEYKL